MDEFKEKSMNTLFYSLWLSLFDSLTTTQQIILFVLLLTTAKPLRNSLSYLAGLSGAYFACGILGYLILDQLMIFLGKYFPSTTALSNPRYYQSEFLMGLCMMVFGGWYFFWKKRQPLNRAENMFLLKLKTMNSLFAFGIGIFISLTSFPVAVPYLIALGKYSSLHLDLPSVSGFILIYNLGYASPMILILAVYLIALRNSEDSKDVLHQKAKMLNIHLITWTMIGFGLFSMIDAGCYFTLGHALIRGRYF